MNRHYLSRRCRRWLLVRRRVLQFPQECRGRYSLKFQLSRNYLSPRLDRLPHHYQQLRLEKLNLQHLMEFLNCRCRQDYQQFHSRQSLHHRSHQGITQQE